MSTTAHQVIIKLVRDEHSLHIEFYVLLLCEEVLIKGGHAWNIQKTLELDLSFSREVGVGHGVDKLLERVLEECEILFLCYFLGRPHLSHIETKINYKLS